MIRDSNIRQFACRYLQPGDGGGGQASPASVERGSSQALRWLKAHLWSRQPHRRGRQSDDLGHDKAILGRLGRTKRQKMYRRASQMLLFGRLREGQSQWQALQVSCSMGFKVTHSSCCPRPEPLPAWARPPAPGRQCPERRGLGGEKKMKKTTPLKSGKLEQARGRTGGGGGRLGMWGIFGTLGNKASPGSPRMAEPPQREVREVRQLQRSLRSLRDTSWSALYVAPSVQLPRASEDNGVGPGSRL